MRRTVRIVPLVLVFFSFALTTTAQIKPRHTDPLTSKVLAPAGFVATVAPEAADAIASQLDPATLADISAFRSAAGGTWAFHVDRRSGGMALAEGRGVRWSGASLGDMAAHATALMTQYPALFQVPLSQLALDRKASLNFGERKQYWNVVFTQHLNGVPVEGARVVFRVNNGNLVQFGVDRTVPRLDAVRVSPLGLTAARNALATFLGGILPSDVFVENGELLWIGRGTADKVGYTGPVGQGWSPALAYRFTFRRDGAIGTWQALVDAATAKVIRFVDANAYAGDEQVTAKASVYTLTNCQDPNNCVPGSEDETAVTMPFARIEFAGGTCEGDGCFTNSAGAYSYPSGAQSSTTILDGKYFQVVDTCGVTTPLALRPEGIDLGTSAKLTTGTNTDCAPATMQSAPGTGAHFAGPGSTHSSRNTYYHLNLIGQKSRFYLPHNDWLKGVEGESAATIPILVNLPPACNAFWNGITLNFMRVTPGLFCNNTGELPDVFLHEYGHGLDSNDLTGTAPESATGEAMGDTFALLEGQHSCIGTGFRLTDPTDPFWANTAGYGNGSRRCSGVRDLDYTKFCLLPDRLVGGLPVNPTPRPEGCRALAIDPDAPQGSRSGLNPPAEPVADAGTPARWNHMIATAPVGVADGQSNYWNCGPPETTGCAGPLNHGCHCESLIASQANWDFAKRLIKSRFGGDVYGLQGPKEISGWQVMDRLWYLTRDIAISAYSVTGDGQTNGCAIDNWYATYRFIDDNDGNLANGTPHSDVMFSAFDLHGIACGAAGDAANQSIGCGAPLPAPTLSVCDTKTPVVLKWTAVAGATQYRILRNTIGANFGYKPIALVPASQLSFADTDVAPGVAYFYTVQPVGENASCYGQVSNSISVTPDACTTSSIAAPGGLTLSTPSANAVKVSWNAVGGAGSYVVLRKDASCEIAGAYVPVATVNGTSWTDTNVQGTHTYSYRVAASASACATCPGPQSSCESISATGACTLPPVFAGVRSVVASTSGVCKLTVNWSPGQASCGASGVTYSVHRSTSADFTPAASNLIATGLSGASYADYGVTSGTRYYYVVRATDSNGNSDGNTVRRYEVATGTLTAGTFVDDGGDAGPAKLIRSLSPRNDWSVRFNGSGNVTKFYATSASGNYADNSCMGLETPTLELEPGAALSFRTRYAIEPGWDGGFVEVATEAGGFSNWTKLQSVTYPGVMASVTVIGCGNGGFADGEHTFTGTTAQQWLTFSGSLDDYAGERVRVRFLFASDEAAPPVNPFDGWLVDDVIITNVLMPASCELSPDAPAISRIVPNSGPAGGGNIVNIMGVNLDGVTEVTFGGVPAAITGSTPTSVTVLAPAHPPGVTAVSVTTEDGTATLTEGYTFLP